MEPRIRIAGIVVPYITERGSPKWVRRYHGLMIHTKKSSMASRNAQPLIGMIIAELLQAVCGEQYMMRLTYSKKEAMIILDYETGCQMVLTYKLMVLH